MPATQTEIQRVERAMRRFRQLGGAERMQRRMREISGVDIEASAQIALACIVECGPIRATELASRLWLDLSVVSRKLRHLVDAGLVERTPDPEDARASLLSATKAGSVATKRMRDARVTALETVLADWSDTDRDQLATLLDRFTLELVELVDDAR